MTRRRRIRGASNQRPDDESKPDEDYMTVQEAVEHLDRWAADMSEALGEDVRVHPETLRTLVAAAHERRRGNPFDLLNRERREDAAREAAAAHEMAQQLLRIHPSEYVNDSGRLKVKKLRSALAARLSCSEKTVSRRIPALSDSRHPPAVSDLLRQS